MKEFEALKAIFEKHNDQTAFYWAIIILLSVNLIAAVANFFQTIYFKNREDKSYRLKIREDRRITIYEELYKFIEELTYFDVKEDNNDLLTKISLIDRYISQNGIYISNDVRNCINVGLDYYRSIVTDFRKKSISEENEFLNGFVRLFNR
jgi:hypothetical protein